MNRGQVNNALEILANAEQNREEQLQQYKETPLLPSSDDENDSDSPILDSFYDAQGGEAVLKLTNFSYRQFFRLFNRFADDISAQWNVGRGKKTEVMPKDLLFMMLALLKHGGCWDLMSKTFRFKTSTFETLLTRFMKLLSPMVFEKLVVLLAGQSTMTTLADKKETFAHFPYAMYATDVTFQQCNRPSGSMQEGKIYYSGKHKLYGLKVEMSVLPNGLAIMCSESFPGSTSDISIMSRRAIVHMDQTKKKSYEENLEDFGQLSETYPNNWGILCDKGYQGAAAFCRAIHPHKKPSGRGLSLEQEVFNDRIKSDRVIVENYFGRMCSLWAITSTKYRWNHDLYSTIMKLCVGLSNLHILWQPLRDNDGANHNRFQNRLYTLGNNIVEKRRLAQRKYRAKRSRKLQSQFHTADDVSTESESNGNA